MVCGSVYQVITNEPTWLITPNGVFFNNSLFIDGCSSSSGDIWIYSDNLLCYGGGSGSSSTSGGSGSNSGSGGSTKAQKLPLLSCEFKTDGSTVSTVSIVSMDDFLEDLRYRGPEIPPLPVLMAAYTIQSKTVYPWWRGEFTAFTKTGEFVTFTGNVKGIPTSAAATAASLLSANDTVD